MKNNKKPVLKYCVASVIMAIAAPMSAATVSIENSGFESSWTGWSDTDPSAISGDANSGSKSAKITGSAGIVEQTVSVDANTEYRLTAYVKGSGSVGAYVNGTEYSQTGGGSDFEAVSVEFNSGSATSITIFGKYNSGDGRFDDFSLESISGGTTPTDPDAIAVPGIVEAEDYSDYYDTTSGNSGNQYKNDDVDIQTTQDSTGNYNVGWTADGEWLEYSIDVQSAGSYTADVRVATSRTNTKSFTLSIDGSQKGSSVSVENTGNWQNWVTKTVNLGTLSAGTHTLRLDISGGNFNINYIDIQKEGSTPPETGDFDWTGWKVTLPVNGDTWYNNGNTSSAAEIQPEGCTDDIFDDSLNIDYFWSDNEGLHFKVPMNLDGKTPNTSYIRSELRELHDWTPCGTTSEANWPYGGTHTLNATVRIDDFDPDGTKVVVGQIHGHDISYATIKLHWEGDSKPVRVIYNETPNSSTPNNIYLGYVDSSDFWDYTIKMTDEGIELSAGGVTEIIRFGEELSNDWKDATFYFKAGLYPQQKPDASSSEVYEATFSDVTVSHN